MSGEPAQPTAEIDDEIAGTTDDADAAEPADDPDPEPAPRSVSVSKARTVGALNAASVSVNRRSRAVLDRKRQGEKHVPWGESDACLLYENVIQIYPPPTLQIKVTRLGANVGSSGSSWYLSGQPRNGRELYETIRQQCHVRSPEAEYSVVFRDAAGGGERGRGRLTMPSGENDPAPPPQYAQSPYGMQQPGYGPQAQQQQPWMGQQLPPAAPPPASPPAQAAPAQVVHEQAPQARRWTGEDRFDEERFGGRGERFERPAPAQQTDTVVLLGLQRQLSDISAKVQQLGQREREPTVVQVPAPAPIGPMPAQAPGASAAPMKLPEIPPGYALTTLGGMMVLVPLPQGLGAVGAASPAAAPVAGAAQAAPAPVAAAPAPQPLSPTEQFAGAIGMITTAVETAKAIKRILPDQQSAPVVSVTAPSVQHVVTAPAPEPEEAPTKVVKMGEVNVVQNVEDGSVRLIDTAIANAPAILSWVDKQRNEYLARQQAAGQPQSAPQQQPQHSQIGAPPFPGR